MSKDLRNIEVRSGVNEQLEGFCTIIATDDAGDIWIGQLSPDEVRQMALVWLQVAEAAEQDAVVANLLRSMGLDDNALGQFIAEMRRRRIGE